VAATEASGKVSMLPGMIQMIVGVIAASIVADPVITLDVNMRSRGMPCPIGGVTLRRWRRMRRGFIRSGAMGGNMPAAYLGLGFMLRESRR